MLAQALPRWLQSKSSALTFLLFLYCSSKPEGTPCCQANQVQFPLSPLLSLLSVLKLSSMLKKGKGENENSER